MKLWLLGLAVAASLPAQTLEGLVVDHISGQPVAGVYLRVPPFPGVDPPLRITDAGGRFRFENVPPNLRTFLDFSRSGYVRGSRTFATKSDLAANFVRLEMTPQAVIAGKIEDEDGFPVRDAYVELMRYQMLNGQRELLPAASWVQPNDRGEFRAFGMSAGRYYLRARPLFRLAQWDGRYSVEYYPSTTDAREATPIEVQAGQEINDIRMRLTKREGHIVTGNVVLPSGIKPPQEITVSLVSSEPTDAGFLTWGEQVHSAHDDGRFTLHHVASHRYTLRASAGNYQRGEPGSLLGEVHLAVGDGDVGGVVVNCHVVQPVDIEGKVIFAGGASPQPMLIGIQGFSGPQPPSIRTSDDGTFVMKGAMPDSYRVQVMAAGATPRGKSVAVVSMRYAGEDVLNKQMEFDGTVAGPLEITVAAVNAEFYPRLAGESRLPAEPIRIVLQGSGGSSQFTWPGTRRDPTIPVYVLPGDYRVLAFDDSIDWQSANDPDFLAAHEKDMTPVHLVAGKNSPVMLTVISR